ncbi:MAG: PrsW family intramembrane metalloprotease, partial [Bacteroidales bacterium]|nr:PrsW family intramembrane metalloprotease [Bacteroidales bacterium]
PVLFYAFFFSDNRKKLVQISFAVGLGFAILENMIMLTQNLDSLDIIWAIIRGFGAGLMHSVCTVAVGMGISFVRKKKKLFYCGTISLLMSMG